MTCTRSRTAGWGPDVRRRPPRGRRHRLYMGRRLPAHDLRPRPRDNAVTGWRNVKLVSEAPAIALELHAVVDAHVRPGWASRSHRRSRRRLPPGLPPVLAGCPRTVQDDAGPRTPSDQGEGSRADPLSGLHHALPRRWEEAKLWAPTRDACCRPRCVSAIEGRRRRCCHSSAATPRRIVLGRSGTARDHGHRLSRANATRQDDAVPFRTRSKALSRRRSRDRSPSGARASAAAAGAASSRLWRPGSSVGRARG